MIAASILPVYKQLKLKSSPEMKLILAQFPAPNHHKGELWELQ